MKNGVYKVSDQVIVIEVGSCTTLDTQGSQNKP